MDTIEKVDTWKEKDSLSEIRKNAEIDWEKFKKEAETAIEKGNIQIEELRKEVSRVDNKDHQKLAEELDCLEERKNGIKETKRRLHDLTTCFIVHISRPHF